ncbi:MAG: ROK family protein, partial [Candidatus Omnitrophota bacterium]
IGGTKISAGLVEGSGKILHRKKISLPVNLSRKKIISVIFSLIQELLEDEGVKARLLKGIGLGVPGIVDQRGVVINAPNISLSGIDICKVIKRRFRVPVVAGNDVNLGVLGERWLGAAQGYKDIVGIFMGTGLGAGVIVDDKLLLGNHGAAAEIGHMLINSKGPKCSCGNYGCLEAYVGRWAIERDIRKELRKGRRSVLRTLLPPGSKIIKSKILAKAISRNDPLITEVMKRAALTVGDACVSLRHIFDPQIIVLGGGVIGACGDFILPLVQERLAKDKFFSKLGKCDVVVSQLEDNATILGAVALTCGI